ncbi:MAG: hypothetical protein VB124_00495 [Burkholderia sp.]
MNKGTTSSSRLICATTPFRPLTLATRTSSCESPVVRSRRAASGGRLR